MERRRTLRSMDAEVARAWMLKLPNVIETMQWGDNLVFWVGDKAHGGKMFALIDLQLDRGLVMSFAAGPERAAELLEREEFCPAPYLARAHWVAASSWNALRGKEWEAELSAAHAYVLGRLPARTRARLGSP